jgi:hypothetical protein
MLQPEFIFYHDIFLHSQYLSNPVDTGSRIGIRDCRIPLLGMETEADDMKPSKLDMNDMYERVIRIDEALHGETGFIAQQNTQHTDIEKRLREIEQKMPLVALMITTFSTIVGAIIMWLIKR